MTTATAIPDNRLKMLDDLVLHHGAHPDFAEGHCAMEVVAYIAGEPHSDHPKCACPVVAAFMRSWNDGISNDETRTRLLKPLLPMLVGTRSTRKVEERRMWMAVDWSLRVRTPVLLRMTGLTEFAEQLEQLPEIASRPTYEPARDVIRKARSAAEKLRDKSWEKLRTTLASAASAASAADAADAAYAAYDAYDAYAASAADAADAAYDADAASAADAAYDAYAAYDADAASAADAAYDAYDAYAAYAASAASAASAENVKRILDAAKTGGYTAARKVADETIGKMTREKLADAVASMQASSQELVRRMCAVTVTEASAS